MPETKIYLLIYHNIISPCMQIFSFLWPPLSIHTHAHTHIRNLGAESNAKHWEALSVGSGTGGSCEVWALIVMVWQQTTDWWCRQLCPKTPEWKETSSVDQYLSMNEIQSSCMAFNCKDNSANTWLFWLIKNTSGTKTASQNGQPRVCSGHLIDLSWTKLG